MTDMVKKEKSYREHYNQLVAKYPAETINDYLWYMDGKYFTLKQIKELADREQLNLDFNKELAYL